MLDMSEYIGRTDDEAAMKLYEKITGKGYCTRPSADGWNTSNLRMPRATFKKRTRGCADAYECAYGRAGRNQVLASGTLSNVESNHIGQESTETVVRGIGQMPKA